MRKWGHITNKFRNLPTGGTYDQVYLAYVDILGFKNLVRKYAKGSPNHLLKIFNLVDSMVHIPIRLEIQRRYLGDSIIMWTKRADELPYILMSCKFIQTALITRGCLVRGAVVRGNHITVRPVVRSIKNPGRALLQKDEVLISPALVTAVENECWLRKKSLPTIVLERSVNSELHKLQKKIKHLRLPIIRIFKASILNGYFSDGAIENVNPRFSPLQSDMTIINAGEAALGRVRKQIMIGLKSKRQDVKNKWKYLLKEYNKIVKLCTKRYQSYGRLLIPE